MTIQKKSLINKLNTTKKAIVASTPAQENPNVSSPVAARLVSASKGARLVAAKGARLVAAKGARLKSL